MTKQRNINPYDIILSNQGYMKIDNYEIAELKSLEIKIVPEMKEIGLLNTVTKGKLITNVNGVINFEFNKIYSRFIPSVLEASKYLQLFTFSLEAIVHTPNKENEEGIFIDTCWLEGDIDIFSLRAENDFLTQKFQAGFKLESADFSSIIDDSNDRYNNKDWSTTSFW